MDVWIWIDIGSLAVAACWLAWRTGGIEAGIALHVVNNLAVTFAVGILLGGLEESMGHRRPPAHRCRPP